MHRKATIVLIALAACPGLAACGGSGDKSSDGKLNRKAIAAKGDSICKPVNAKADEVPAPVSVENAAAAAAYFAKLVPLHQKETDDLAALKPDDAVKADWDAFMVTQNANNTLLKTILDKATAKDASGQQDLQQIAPKVAASTAAAKKVGMTECGT
jgi:hypothetical protein